MDKYSTENPNVIVFDSDSTVRENLTQRLTEVGCRVQSVSCLNELPGVTSEPATLIGYSLEMVEKHIQLPFDVVGEPPADAAIAMSASIVNDTISICQGGGILFLVPPFEDQELKKAVDQLIKVDIQHRRNNAFKDETLNKIAALPEREQQVMEMIFNGMMNKNIARRLNVSLRTVEADRANLFEKFGAESAVDLVRVLCECGYETEESCEAKLGEEE